MKDIVNLNILNKNFEKIAIVDDYTSLIWAKRYNATGALDLQVEASERNLTIFQKFNYIARDDDDAIFRIEAVELDTSAEQENYLIVGAYDCKKILSQRIIWNQINFEGTVEQYIRRIITDNCIVPEDASRKLPIALKPSKGYPEQIEAQSQYEQLDEKITELCTANGYGWKITLEGSTLYFELFKGTDRSIDQSENPRIVFSPEYDNLSSAKYNLDAGDYKNVALVGGEGEGTEKKTAIVGGASGLERFEMFVSSSASTNSGEDEIDYYQALRADGLEALAAQATTEKFEGEIDPESYKYKVDYDLGDIVTVMNEYGARANARIVEVAETWNEEGYSIDPVFEYMKQGD